ncbi:MAG TPA: hypothetical protein VGN09_06385 [Vicinamibacteria bacterium]
MRTTRAAGVLFAFAAIGFTFAARRGREGAAELEPHPPRAAAVSPPPFVVKLPPPTASEVEAGLRRAFGETVRPSGLSRLLVGDFNGDGSEDVAVPVSPAEGRLAELNDGLANWRIQDALDDPAERPGPREGARSALTVQPQDVLLAVVHGYGVRGWRDERARQSYLVRHATGAPLEARPRSDLLRYVRRVPDDARLTGDVIFASAGRTPGFVYWTGARYSWHPLPSRAQPP